MGLCLVGASLGMAGALIQTLLQNPLADPALLGLSSGSTLAVVFWMVSCAALGYTTSSFSLSLFAVLGAALVSLLILFLLNLTRRFGIAGIILLGVALNAILGAIISLMLVFSNQLVLSQALMWTLGSVGYLTYPQILCSVLLLTCGLLCTIKLLPSLDKLLLGEKSAFIQGVSPVRFRTVTLMVIALFIGGAVVLSGPIAFVGLLVPHLARMCVGPRHRLQLFCCAIFGVLWLLLADEIRLFFLPVNVPVGLICALIGGPFFILLLLSLGRARHA